MIGAIILFGIAGHETTTKAIGSMAYRLWQHPGQHKILIDDPSGIPMAAEELRFDGSSQILSRKVGEDITLHGKTLQKGQTVGLCPISANRDGAKFENAETFDITRGSRDDSALGLGIHFCLDAALARLEMKVATEGVLAVDPRLRDRSFGPAHGAYFRCPVL